MTRSRVLCGLAFVLLASPAAYFAWLQYAEFQAIDAYIARHDLQSGTVDFEAAKHVAQVIRADFLTDTDQFDALDLSDRPFLRESTLFLLKHQEGLCGEGTRVLISVLHRLGFDAARISLYDRNLRSAHTLAAVRLNDRNVLVDSINSHAETTRLLESERVTPKLFGQLQYADSTYNPAYDKAQPTANASPDVALFKKRYWMYSYETLPLTKLLAKLGLESRVFIRDRPPRSLAILAERPLTVYAIVSGVLGLLLWLFGCWFARRAGKRRQADRTA